MPDKHPRIRLLMPGASDRALLPCWWVTGCFSSSARGIDSKPLFRLPCWWVTACSSSSPNPIGSGGGAKRVGLGVWWLWGGWLFRYCCSPIALKALYASASTFGRRLESCATVRTIKTNHGIYLVVGMLKPPTFASGIITTKAMLAGLNIQSAAKMRSN